MLNWRTFYKIRGRKLVRDFAASNRKRHKRVTREVTIFVALRVAYVSRISLKNQNGTLNKIKCVVVEEYLK